MSMTNRGPWLVHGLLFLFFSFFTNLFFSTGPISSILVNKYGSRPIMMVGGCLSGTGLVAASFCNTVEGLYFCVGVIGGKYTE